MLFCKKYINSSFSYRKIYNARIANCEFIIHERTRICEKAQFVINALIFLKVCLFPMLLY